MTSARQGLLPGHDRMRDAEEIAVSLGSVTSWDATGSSDVRETHPACAWERGSGHLNGPPRRMNSDDE